MSFSQDYCVSIQINAAYFITEVVSLEANQRHDFCFKCSLKSGTQITNMSNSPKREVRTNPNEITDSGQRHEYITTSFGGFKCLLFVHCAHMSIV